MYETVKVHFCIGLNTCSHSSVLAWRIPGMGEPGGLPSMGSRRVGHDWSNVAAAAANTCSCTICWTNNPFFIELYWHFCQKSIGCFWLFSWVFFHFNSGQGAFWFLHTLPVETPSLVNPHWSGSDLPSSLLDRFLVVFSRYDLILAYPLNCSQPCCRLCCLGLVPSTWVLLLPTVLAPSESWRVRAADGPSSGPRER